jgi:hypothetical protein
VCILYFSSPKKKVSKNSILIDGFYFTLFIKKIDVTSRKNCLNQRVQID